MILRSPVPGNISHPRQFRIWTFRIHNLSLSLFPNCLASLAVGCPSNYSIALRGFFFSLQLMPVPVPLSAPCPLPDWQSFRHTKTNWLYLSFLVGCSCLTQPSDQDRDLAILLCSHIENDSFLYFYVPSKFQPKAGHLEPLSEDAFAHVLGLWRPIVPPWLPRTWWVVVPHILVMTLLWSYGWKSPKECCFPAAVAQNQTRLNSSQRRAGHRPGSERPPIEKGGNSRHSLPSVPAEFFWVVLFLLLEFQ